MSILSNISVEADKASLQDDHIVRNAVRVARHAEQAHVRELLTAVLNTLYFDVKAKSVIDEISQFFRSQFLSTKISTADAISMVVERTIATSHEEEIQARVAGLTFELMDGVRSVFFQKGSLWYI